MIAVVKDSANNARVATVENLRQLKLPISCEDACHLFRRRIPALICQRNSHHWTGYRTTQLLFTAGIESLFNRGRGEADRCDSGNRCRRAAVCVGVAAPDSRGLLLSR